MRKVGTMLKTNETIASAAKSAPLITREQEHADAVAWLSRGDLAARERLFRSHLRIVVKIANQMQGRATIDELQAEGCVGLAIWR
jgi:DNA-directed RNA polymerase sigma subunit (sigma70/sigma32)